MKTKQTYLEVCMNSASIGKSQVIVAGVTSIEVSCEKLLTNQILLDALYRTISKNSRLSIIFEDIYTLHQAPTLDRLDLNYSIQEIKKPLTKSEIEHHLDQALNMHFEGSQLPWQVCLFVYRKPNTFQYELFIRISMLHALTDGYGMVMICKTMVESIHQSLYSKPLDLTTKVPPHCPSIESLLSLADKRFVPHPLLYPFVFLWRLLMGLWFMLLAGSGFILPIRIFSGTLDPRHDIYTTKQKMTGTRILDIDYNVLKQLRLESKKVGGSVGSILTVAGLTAYKAVAQRYNKDTWFVNAHVLVNTRPFIADHSKMDQLQASTSGTVNIEFYTLQNSDYFWTQVHHLKKRIHAMMIHVPSFLIVTQWMPLFIIRQTFACATPDKPRNLALLLSNMGEFHWEKVHWAPNIKVKNIVGSANSYWAGNRALFQITSVTMDGHMQLVVNYPTHMVTESDSDYFCQVLIKSLEQASKNPTLTVGDVISMNKKSLE